LHAVARFAPAAGSVKHAPPPAGQRGRLLRAKATLVRCATVTLVAALVKHWLPLAQVVCESAVRRVEVQETRPRRAAESVHDLGRCADERARLERLLLVVHEHGEAALEHVERVRMLSVEVRLGAVARIGEQGFGDAELFERGLEHDPAAEERLALARLQHHTVHRGRV